MAGMANLALKNYQMGLQILAPSDNFSEASEVTAPQVAASLSGRGEEAFGPNLHLQFNVIPR